MRIHVLAFLFFFAVFFASCDRVEITYRDIPDLDSTYYPGVWGEYILNEWPTFEQNTNVQRNVLIDKFTGHRCGPCTKAADTISNISADFPNRVFYASIHAGPTGLGYFQSFNESDNEFFSNHTNSIGLAYGIYFNTGFGFSAMPGLSVNKELFGGTNSNMFALPNDTRTRVLDVFQTNDLQYNIQSTFRYFPESHGGYLHVEVEKLINDNPNVDLVVYVLQDSLRDWQTTPNGNVPNYKHKNKHLGNIDNQVWGQRLNFSESNKVYKDYSFGKPSGIEPENIHFLIFVSDSESKKVYQVIKQKMIE